MASKKASNTKTKGSGHGQRERAPRCYGFKDIPEGRMGLVVGRNRRRIHQIENLTNTTLKTSRERGLNRVYISGESEEAIEQAEIEICRAIYTGRRRSTSGEKTLYFVDTKEIGQTIRVVNAAYPGSKTFYKLVSTTKPGENIACDDSHIKSIRDAVEELLVDVRKESTGEADRSPRLVDVSVHIGQLLLLDADEDVTTSETTASYDIPTVLDKLEIRADGTRAWLPCLVPVFTERDVRRLEQLFEAKSDVVSTCECFDVGFYTPSCQRRRFRIYKASDEDGAASLDSLSIPERGELCVRAGAGFLSTNYATRLTADVFLPEQQCDFCLTVKTGSKDPPRRTKTEKEEDEMLIKRFCEKVKFRDEDPSVPPKKVLPKGYYIHFQQQSKRKTLELNGFEITLSCDTSVEYKLPVQHEKKKQINIYIRSKACEALVNENMGRTWTPEGVAQFIPEMIKFVKERINLLEQDSSSMLAS